MNAALIALSEALSQDASVSDSTRAAALVLLAAAREEAADLADYAAANTGF